MPFARGPADGAADARSRSSRRRFPTGSMEFTSARPSAVSGDPAGAGIPRVTYISWAESCSRSDHTARELGGTSHMVYAGRFGSRASTILLKYIAQSIETVRVLRRECPDAVFVMTPPLFAALPALWYGWRRQK